MIPLTYHGVVRRRVHRVFELLSRDDWAPILRDTAPDVHHVFPGDHPLGGERHGRDAVEAWSKRLARLFPGHRFAVDRIVVSGWPWDTWVSVAWSARLVPREGPEYSNEGVHWLRLRWGKLTYLHAYLDSQAVARACERMAAAGIDEASAAPI